MSQFCVLSWEYLGFGGNEVWLIFFLINATISWQPCYTKPKEEFDLNIFSEFKIRIINFQFKGAIFTESLVRYPKILDSISILRKHPLFLVIRGSEIRTRRHQDDLIGSTKNILKLYNSSFKYIFDFKIQLFKALQMALKITFWRRLCLILQFLCDLCVFDNVNSKRIYVYFYIC